MSEFALLTLFADAEFERKDRQSVCVCEREKVLSYWQRFI